MAIAVLAGRTRVRPAASQLFEIVASYTNDLNPAAVIAGVTTFIWYAVGLLPVQVRVASQFGQPTAQVSSWIFIIWLTGCVASITLSLLYRQPIPISSSIPGLLFLGTMADKFSFPDLVGAGIVAGAIIAAFGLLGIGRRVLAWLPMSVVMGMLAGTVFADINTMVQATVSGGLVPVVTVLGYLAGRLVGRPHVPPIAVALFAGAVALTLSGPVAVGSLDWQPPTLVRPDVAFNPSAVFALSIPLVVLSMGIGNVQGLGFLSAQGYRVPVGTTTFVVGLNSIVNALFGGHVAIVSRNAMPIMAGPDAGPLRGRYWASVISGALCLAIAIAAGPVSSLLAVLPRAYIVVLSGLAILPAFQNALEHAFAGKLRFGAMIAMIVAASPFTFLGLTSACWALVAALLASYAIERRELQHYWRRSTAT